MDLRFYTTNARHERFLSNFDDGEWRMDARLFTREANQTFDIITIQYFFEFRQIRFIQ